MGLFNKIFGENESATKEEKNVPWNALTAISQLDEIAEESKSQPVAIFKHSTRCGISRMVIRQFESAYDIDISKMKLYYLDLLNYRNVSDEVGYRFQVLHQSPQLLVIKNGTAIAHASHNGILAKELENFV